VKKVEVISPISIHLTAQATKKCRVRVRYAAYYHLWTSIVFMTNRIIWKAKRRADTSDTMASSVFEDSGKVNQDDLLSWKPLSGFASDASQAHHFVIQFWRTRHG